ncbi:MAG: hypothetical protein IPK80_00835 [Nannocystis sp.]|nr:hypothetical protein [Nannocystis sp.]
MVSSACASWRSPASSTRASSHADGSCDDYFPFERALGALVFSTYAMTEAYMELGLQRPDLVDFFRLRGDWLRTHNETGQLANHQAFAALALYNIYQITGDDAYRRASDDFCNYASRGSTRRVVPGVRGSRPRLSHLHDRLPRQALSKIKGP